MDIRLFRKAKQLTEPFNYEEYKKNKIKEAIDKERINRVKVHKLPKVNAELARKVIEETKLGKSKTNSTVLEDNRFTALFSDTNYQIDKESEEYRLLNPVVKKMNEKTSKKSSSFDAKFDEVSEEEEDDASVKNGSDESSSDDEHTWKDYKKEYNEIQKEKKMNNRNNKKEKVKASEVADTTKQPKFYEIKDDLEYFSNNTDILKKEKLKKLPIEKRMQIINKNDNDVVIEQNDSIGNKQMTFLSRKVISKELFNNLF